MYALQNRENPFEFLVPSHGPDAGLTRSPIPHDWKAYGHAKRAMRESSNPEEWKVWQPGSTIEGADSLYQITLTPREYHKLCEQFCQARDEIGHGVFHALLNAKMIREG